MRFLSIKFCFTIFVNIYFLYSYREAGVGIGKLRVTLFLSKQSSRGNISNKVDSGQGCRRLAACDSLDFNISIQFRIRDEVRCPILVK